MYTLTEKAGKVKLLVMDVDGVLTDGRIFLGNQGQELKCFNSQDGLGIKLLQEQGLEAALITGRESKIVSQRAEELGIKTVFQGIEDKGKIFEEIARKYSLKEEQIAYIGDDLNDLPPLTKAGFACVVDNGVRQVKQNADYVTKRKGGSGAVREVIDLILEQRP